MPPPLTTSQLAERVGVPAGTLRMWEARYGFPTPTRLPGGHRRYDERDVELVREVVRLRESGTSLPAAVLEATARERATAESIFAQLTARWPDLQPLMLTAAPLLALTRAIEDEYAQRGAPGVLIGSFQRRRHFRQAEPRWRRLARASTVTVALADFRSPRLSAAGVHEIPVSREHPLAREWSVVTYTRLSRGTAGACLAAWEVPRSTGPRCFEVVISADPAAVHCAAAYVAEVVHRHSPDAAAATSRALGPAPGSGPNGRELRSAQGVTHRLVDYLLAQQ